MLQNKRALLTGAIKICLLATVLFSGFSSSAQETLDKIAAVVGRNRIILKSDVEAEFAQMKQNDPNLNDSVKCYLLQQLIVQKFLMEQAERDSVIVSDEDVDAQMDNRLRYFTQLYGSKEKLEQAAGKTIYQIKDEQRDAIREQMTAEKMQGQILENVKITPAEVETFYKAHADSLPFYPASVEVGQIVIDPPVSPQMDQYARQQIESIRNDIVNNGKSFEMEAELKSQDPGSRDNGGRYDGVQRNGPWAPEFLAAAFKLQNGEISPVIKTKFGYHIIQMIQRRGDEADLRHILIIPEVTSYDFKQSLDKLDSVRSELVAGKITFPEAVGKYSTDDAAKRTGGMIADPATGNTIIEISKLDPEMVVMLDSMKPGQFSQPQVFITEGREKSCRIVYLKTRTAPHKANLKDDYAKLQDVALAQKKTKKIQEWVTGKLPNIYLKIDPEFQQCSALKGWQTSSLSPDSADK